MDENHKKMDISPAKIAQAQPVKTKKPSLKARLLKRARSASRLSLGGRTLPMSLRSSVSPSLKSSVNSSQVWNFFVAKKGIFSILFSISIQLYLQMSLYSTASTCSSGMASVDTSGSSSYVSACSHISTVHESPVNF